MSEPTNRDPSELTVSCPIKGTFRWAPKEDITTHELALIMPTFLAATTGDAFAVHEKIEALPEKCRRHFEHTEPKTIDTER